ncbi:MAG: hypothetical protein IAG13_24965, partial [Deltaproteobacteria bacterium]|nr:hypothetical protein [Nannocystaceae bacterium]
PYDGGLEAAGEQQPCKTIDDVRALVASRQPFGLIYLAIDTRAEFDLAFHDVDERGYNVTANIEKSLVYYKDEEHGNSGRWLEGFLISIVTALAPKVCAYGNTMLMDPDAELSVVLAALRRVRYIALDPEEVVGRLRTGDLLALPWPVFHAIRTDLIQRSEIVALMKRRPCSPRLEYKLAPEHHVLMDVAQPK